MGAGFGHLYDVDGDVFPAWAISPSGLSMDNHSAETQMNWGKELEEFVLGDTLTVQYKGRTFEVPLVLESTYYGDDYCVLPEEYMLWENYREAVEEASNDPDRIDWNRLFEKEKSKADLNMAFTVALLERVQENFPFAFVRKRSAGWLASRYEAIGPVLSEIKASIEQAAREKALRHLQNDKTRPQLDPTDTDDGTTSSAPPPMLKRTCRF